ncbi:MAG: hypothetical protein ABSA30_09885 [Candidatus Aminicenantales bacterium]
MTTTAATFGDLAGGIAIRSEARIASPAFLGLGDQIIAPALDQGQNFGGMPGHGLAESAQAPILVAGPLAKSRDIVARSAFLDEAERLEDAQAVAAIVQIRRAVAFHLFPAGQVLGLQGRSGGGVQAHFLGHQIFVERDLPLVQGGFDLAEEDASGEILKRRMDVGIGDAADGNPVVIVSLLMDVDRDLGHEFPENPMDGGHSFGLDFDVVAVHVEFDLIHPDVEVAAVRVGLGHDQDVQPLEERLQFARGEIAQKPQGGFLGRLLIAVLSRCQQNGRLGPVELAAAQGPVPADHGQKNIPGRKSRNILRPPDDADFELAALRTERA